MQEIKCASCGKQRHELKGVNSKLKPSMRFAMCGSCISQGWEPKWLIIITAKQGPEGFAIAKPFIKGKKYYGEKILGEQLL